ncbi:MAG: phosphoribosylformylglycinamidine synthase [Clostridia bacterium]|nr:phosphoribosylformylglycinamidine synthase [Clostridia bacterium]
MVRTVYVEKKKEYDVAAGRFAADVLGVLGVELKNPRHLIRYCVDGLSDEQFDAAVKNVFSEPPLDVVYDNVDFLKGDIVVVEYLDGQYDQRMDSAVQCVQFLTGGLRPLIKCATVYAFDSLDATTLARVKKHLINPVDSKEGSLDVPESLKPIITETGKMRVEQEGFIALSESELKEFYSSFSFAMTMDDLKFVQAYFVKEGRNPTLTELKVIDTYWSDHCRHTTFNTELKSIKVIDGSEDIQRAVKHYLSVFEDNYKGRADKYPCLMSIATLAARQLKKDGYLNNLDESDEINACSVVVNVDVDGKDEEWLIMFKNETHNHPTEIEPFGGAATCLGGAIRDPLSGRTYVYQAMRVTGADFPAARPTLKGKLPQQVISKKALSGFSSYGNQIGLATGIVAEKFDEGYRAKRLETGYVIGGNKKENVIRCAPKGGDIVVMVGGDTGRDGCGGATGSSKSHNVASAETCGAEVQKGNPPEERKLQRLFRNPEASKLIIKCNDFGAGGVCVAIGELSAGLDIYLDRVNKKYEGLTATELAISESQERMAVVVKAEDADKFIALAEKENLKSVKVATVTDGGRLRMFYRDETIVDISREFLDTNGVKQTIDAEITDTLARGFFDGYAQAAQKEIDKDARAAVLNTLSLPGVCSQKGMGENFDSTIGAATVLMPFGGKHQLTPSMVMASKPPVSGVTHTVTCSSFALYPELNKVSPFVGAAHSIVSAVSKLVASGVKYDSIRLTLQEFFKKLGKDPRRWGEPLSALLGAFEAQMGLKIAAIGGKDSMSGSFENLDVPPTLIAFAMGITDDRTLIHNTFDTDGYIYELAIPRRESGLPDFDGAYKLYAEVESLIAGGKVASAAVVEEGGRACAVIKSLLGSGKGAKMGLRGDDFAPHYGNIILVAKDKLSVGTLLGEVTDGNVVLGNTEFTHEELRIAFEKPLDGFYPTTAPASGEIITSNAVGKTYSAASKIARPRVFIPAFPGTNCELDTARVFDRAGAETDIFVVKNQKPSDIQESIDEIVKRISNSQIIAFPGGFSAGDEPDGSGKFIATLFKNPYIMEAVEKMLYTRDGLMLGICNGFQALIKLGLLPYGKIGKQNEDSPTLTYNNIARHVSTICRVRVGSTCSPWLSGVKVGDIYNVPVSHGEGKFTATKEHFDRMLAAGQIFSQYADMDGNVTMESPHNPNGSYYGVEGILSPDGRIIGKMGHAERIGVGLYKNIPGEFDMKIFESGVKYYK